MKALRITQLDLRQIGPFGDLTLHFPEKPSGMEDKAEIHILTGENGTGKTTVLEMLAMGLSNGNFGMAGLSKNNALDTGRFRQREAPSVLNLTYNNQEQFNLLSKISGQKVQEAKIITQDFWNGFGPNGKFNFAIFSYSGTRTVEHISIDGIREIPTHPFDAVFNFSNAINPKNLLQWIANTIAAEAIANTDDDAQEALRRREAITRIENCIKRIIDKPIKFRLSTKPFAVKIEIDHERLDFNQLPDGLKSIIAWIADLLMRMDRVQWVDDTPVFERNFILLLDEIEVHMHPAWQRKILPAVQQLFPNAQIFISTHSPFVVGSVDGAWIHKLEKPNGDSKLTPGYPKRSEDARSYRYWLEEVFGIDSEYGVGAEKELKHFYELRSALLKGANGTTQDDLITTARSLAGQSKELQNIMEFELRQLNRTLQTTLSL